MRPRALDLAVVGCGAVVEGLYVGALRKLESQGLIRVSALIDPNPARGHAIERRLHSARVFATLTEALASRRPDLTIVASPPGLHAQHVVEAIDAGSHVLCEKPMTTTIEDAERVVAAAKRSGRVLAAGMVRRLFPCLATAREMLAAGAIGDRVRFMWREGSIYGWPVSSDAPFRRETGGGGVLTDIGSHVIDFLTALFGQPTVTAFADDGQSGGVETNCRIGLSLPGASGVVQLSWNEPLVNRFHLVGSVGEMVLDPAALGWVWWRGHGESWQARAGTATWPSDLRSGGQRGTPRNYYDCIYYQLVQALRAAVLGEPVPATGEDELVVVRAIDACYRQAMSLQRPWLTEEEQAQADALHWSRRQWAA